MFLHCIQQEYKKIEDVYECFVAANDSVENEISVITAKLVYDCFSCYICNPFSIKLVVVELFDLFFWF